MPRRRGRARSSRGTSRCSCWRGRSRRRSRRETRWCSSRRSSPRSPRCCFAELCRRGRAAAGRASTSSPATATPATRIVDHPDVDKIAFTGSTEVGRIIRTATAGSGKKLSLELGGKSPFIVFDDADLDSVVEGVVDAIWFNQGQVCCAGSRLLVQEGVADRLVDEAARADGDAARRRSARQGGGHGRHRRAGAARADPGAGAARARTRAPTMWQPSWSCPREGCFYPPTLFTDVSPAATIAQVEIFGPVLVLMTFRTPAEAVALANNTRVRPRGERLDREHQPRARHRAEDQGGHGLDQLHQRLRRGERVRRLPGERVRTGRGAGGAVGVREVGRTGDRAVGRSARSQQPAQGEAARVAGSATARPPSPPDRRSRPSTAPPSCTSAASRRARTRATVCPVLDAAGRAHRRGGGGEPEGHPQRGGGGAQGGAGGREATAHKRAQVLYYIAENLARAPTSSPAARALTGDARRRARGGARRSSGSSPTPRGPTSTTARCTTRRIRSVTLAMHEPIGVMGVVCPDAAPLLGFVSRSSPAIAMGNTVVVVPSAHGAARGDRLLPGARHLGRAGRRDQHRHRAARGAGAGARRARRRGRRSGTSGRAEGAAAVERLSAGNMKRTWVSHGHEPRLDRPASGRGARSSCGRRPR